MSQIMKAFTGVFILLFLTIASMGILACFLQVLHAENLHTSIVDELENSNYARPVLEESFLACEEANYELEVILYLQGEESVVCKTKTDIPSNLQDVQMAKINLSYPISLSFFQLKEEKQLSGYGR